MPPSDVVLDPATLRHVADDLAQRADHLARCCGGQHPSHAARIATYAEISTDLRTRAIRAELDQARAGGPS